MDKLPLALWMLTFWPAEALGEYVNARWMTHDEMLHEQQRGKDAAGFMFAVWIIGMAILYPYHQ